MKQQELNFSAHQIDSELFCDLERLTDESRFPGKISFKSVSAENAVVKVTGSILFQHAVEQDEFIDLLLTGLRSQDEVDDVLDNNEVHILRDNDLVFTGKFTHKVFEFGLISKHEWQRTMSHNFAARFPIAFGRIIEYCAEFKTRPNCKPFMSEGSRAGGWVEIREGHTIDDVLDYLTARFGKPEQDEPDIWEYKVGKDLLSIYDGTRNLGYSENPYFVFTMDKPTKSGE